MPPQHKLGLVLQMVILKSYNKCIYWTVYGVLSESFVWKCDKKKEEAKNVTEAVRCAHTKLGQNEVNEIKHRSNDDELRACKLCYLKALLVIHLPSQIGT